MNIQDAEKLVNEYTCLNLKPVTSSEDQQKLHQALQALVAASEYQLLGICANSQTEGIEALKSYLNALGYPMPDLDLSTEMAGSVYIKFNGLRQTCHLDSYEGEYRGVLVSCQSSDPNGVNGTYGYFPLDLYRV